MVDRTSSEFRSYLDLYERAPLLDLGEAADRARWALHPESVVTYIVDRNINYTNVCVADCKFCAFYRRPKDREGYVLSFEEIGRKIDAVKALGGVQILMQGGHNPYIPFEWYLDLLRYIKRNHPIHIHGFSPSEIDFFGGRFGMTIEEVIRALVAAGLDSKAKPRAARGPGEVAGAAKGTGEAESAAVNERDKPGTDPTAVFVVPAVESPRATLREIRPDGSTQSFVVDGRPLTIGRGPDNGLVLQDSRASRHHARIYGRQGALLLADLGSTNGSWVNDRRIQEIALGEGDQIRIGDTVLVVESVEEA